MALVVTTPPPAAPATTTLWHPSPSIMVATDGDADSKLKMAASTPSSSSSPALASENVVVKDEMGQDINCVVCGDKSSGKHYGQYTCEGKLSILHYPYTYSVLLRTINMYSPMYQVTELSRYCTRCTYTYVPSRCTERNIWLRQLIVLELL